MTIRVDLVGDKLGDLFLVCGAQDKLGVFPISKFVELATHDGVSTGLMPEFRREQVGHRYARGMYGAELLIYDVGDLANDAKSVGKERKDA